MKKSIKKLSLNKMTIANLDSKEMNKLAGGVSGWPCLTVSCKTMNTCSPTCRYC